MTIQRYLLSTTALLGLGVASIPSAQALDVTVNGFMGFRAAGGDLKEATGTARGNGNFDGPHSLDFSTDTEVHVNARATADNGIRYGATVEFEADTDQNINTDEAWMFLEGGFGGLRFGDDDGAADNMKITGANVAAGTGGIDGAIIAIGIGPSNSGDDTKIRYDGSFGPVQVGLSYTPDDNSGNSVGDTNAGTFKDLIEGGIVFAPDFAGDFDLELSVVGGIGDDDTGDADFETVFGGAQFGFAGFNIAGGIGTETWNDVDRDVYNVGVGATFGDVAASVTYGLNDVDGANDTEQLTLSANVGIVPGVVLAGDVSWFDYDATDDGVAGVVRIRTAF